MKKLSMLAAGVVVLSMCACTEANEFTPSTNNSTKRITEIKVSANPSPLGSRTVFHTGNDGYDYGVVTWEQGVDKIYFNKPVASPQCFTCGRHDKLESEYDWSYFEADIDGLEVGSTYYVNNKPSGYDYSDYRGVPCNKFTISSELKQDGSDDKLLQQFMKDYDLLMSNSSVLAQEKMDPICMNHAFSLIAVDLQCTNPGPFTNNSDKPLFFETDLAVNNSDGINCFAFSFNHDFDGKIQFKTGNDQTYVASVLRENPWALDEGETKEKLTFYLLLHSFEPVSELSFMFKTKSQNLDGSSTCAKTVNFTLKEPFTFELGKFYHFGFGVDYQPRSVMGHTYGDNFNYAFDWQNFNANQIFLLSIPENMKVKQVSNNTPS